MGNTEDRKGQGGKMVATMTREQVQAGSRRRFRFINALPTMQEQVGATDAIFGNDFAPGVEGRYGGQRLAWENGGENHRLYVAGFMAGFEFIQG